MLVTLAVALLLLGELSAAQAQTSDTPRAHGVRFGEPDTSRGVRALQLQLRRAGVRPGRIDGRLGPLTEAAVRRFQRRQGLEVDGVVGAVTAAALRRPRALVVPGSGLDKPKGFRRVRLLQRRLRLAGARPGAVDGRFGPRTEAAVRRFQRRVGMTVDGRVNRATAVKLAKRSAATKPASTRGSAPGQAPTKATGTRPNATPSGENSRPTYSGGPGTAGTSGGSDAAGKNDSGGGWSWMFLLAALLLIAAIDGDRPGFAATPGRRVRSTAALG